MKRKINETIPGQTPFDEDYRADLIPAHIATLVELNEYEAANINKASTHFLLGDAKRWKLTQPELINQIHREMSGDVWRWAGRYRSRATNLGVAPAMVAQNLAQLCKDLEYWIEKNTYSNKREMAVIFHHRLVAIHPFPNGNGRLSRICADLLVRQLGAPPISWPGSLGNQSESRSQYIEALRRADAGDYEGLSHYWSAFGPT